MRYEADLHRLADNSYSFIVYLVDESGRKAVRTHAGGFYFLRNVALEAARAAAIVHETERVRSGGTPLPGHDRDSTWMVTP